MGGQIALLVLAVLALTSEYSSGSIRLTFVAAPGRLRVVAAKAVVVTAVSALLAVVSLPVAYVECLSKLSSLELHPTLPSVLGGFGVHVGYLILVALFALGDGLHRELEKHGFTQAAHSLFAGSSIGTLLADAVTVTVWLAVPLLIGGVALVRKDA